MSTSSDSKPLCPLCERPLGMRSNVSRHHLIPMSKGGKKGVTVDLHNICHRKIHSLFTNRELETHYYSIALLRENPQIKKFIKWVSRKPPEFYDRSRESNQRKAKRQWKS